MDVAQAIIVILVLQSIEFLARRGRKGSERLFEAAVIGNGMLVIFALGGAGLLLQWTTIPMESASLPPLSCHHPIRPIQKRARAKAGVAEAMIDPVAANL